MFNASDKIKLNEEIFPENKRTEKHFQAGQLNYPALILDWEMEVIDSFTDSYHGNMVKVKVLNDERIEEGAVVYMRVDDCVLSKATKLKIDFTILGKMLKVQPLIDSNRAARTALMKSRNLMRKKHSLSSNEMKKNWNEVQALDLDLKRLLADTSVVLVVETKALGKVNLECSEDQIENKIRSLIRSKRSAARKIIPETKTIAGEVKYNKIGGVMEKAGEIAKISKDYAIKVMDTPKKPTTLTDNFVGIEIECFSKKTIPEMKEEYIRAGLKKFVNITTDGSISPESGYNGMEIRVCIPESALETILPQVFAVLENNKAKVNSSCGTHVHFDMRNRKVEQVYENLFKVQNLMFATQPSARRKSTYCKKSVHEKLKLTEFDVPDRYSAINTRAYKKHQTIEIRLHEGTVKYEEMKNWINFLVPIINAKNVEKTIDTIKDLEDTKLVESSVLKYLDKRVKKFA